ncbi:transcriptional regulator, PadR family [Stackebrandtia albiflava]|uniref:Transcriptional regulator, PadR family n=1 Tax=Stackebrandtia albiflava TaxID=406432 RepID=A0A562V9X9_9ACTN|nr:PadR family transcriptional regulator [Stackebrandtia albiflava]TWJ14672.1 transcriptional regulator, PadR family [Stackebrandtia albiflava]
MAGRRAGPDLVGTTVLAVLNHGPRHTYDLHRFLVDTHKDYVTGLPRSLYHAVDRLVADGLVIPVETTREGRRPERTVHRITAPGREELAERLRRLLTTIGRDTTPFVAAVSLMGGLPAGEAARALRERAAGLRQRVDAATRTLAELTRAGLPRLPLLEIEYERSRHAAELAWVESLADEMTDGRIDWGIPPPAPTGPPPEDAGSHGEDDPR